MGKTSVYLGETGSAAKMKLVVNMIMVGSGSEGRGGGEDGSTGGPPAFPN